MATRNTNIVVPNLVKPNVSGSINQWGYILNEDLDKITEFSKKVIADSEMQNQELTRLENEKLNIEDIPSKVEPVVQEFLETTIKPQIDDYIDETSKPSLDDYVVVKKGELDQYVTNTSKPSLDTYTGEKKNELNTHTAAKKEELDTYTGTKKTQLDSYTTEKEEELDAHVVVKKGDLDSYTTTKKQEINTFTEEQKGELDTYEKSKENELNVYTGDKKRELDTYEGEKETELNQHTQTKITELSNHTNTKKGELDTYTTQKKGEITTHTDSEIERINADSELAKKQNITDSRLQTDSKEIVGAINESLWSIGYKALSTVNDFNELTQSGVFYGRAEVDTLNAPFTPPFSFILINYNRGGLIEQTVITGVDDIVVRRQLGTRWRNWEKTLRTNTKEFLGNAGISSIVYIQDSGTKTQGQGYIDKSTGQVYLCLETNTDTTITNKFMSITNVELGKKVKSGFWKLNPKQIGNASTVTDLNTIYKRGFYVSTSDVNKFINVPESYMGAFELTVSGITDTISYTTQLIKDIRNNNYYVRTQTAGIGNTVSWTKWTKLLLDTDIVDNLTTADKSKVLSANMGNKIWTDRNKTNTYTASNNKGEYYGEVQGNYDGVRLALQNTDGGATEFIGMAIGGTTGNTGLTRPIFRQRVSNNAGEVSNNTFEIFHQGNYEKNKIMLGNMGVNNLIYIQDAGQKTAGNGYVDKTTGSLYLCKVTTTDTSVTDKFLLATNIENRDRISIIEEKLGIYHPVGKISTISVSRDENSSSPNLSFSSL